jgi:hypothetical protein
MHARSSKRKQERLSLVTLVKHEDDRPYLELEHEQYQSVKSRETERAGGREGVNLYLCQLAVRLSFTYLHQLVGL